MLRAATIALAFFSFPADATEPVEWMERFGGWTARCDRCAVHEEPICTLSARAGNAWLLLFPIGDETDPDPLLALEYLPSRPLAFETRGELTVAIDDAAAWVIAHPDVLYLAMTEGLYVEAPVVADLLPELAGGRELVLGSDDADSAGSDTFTLAGFADALAAMRNRLPIPRASLEFMESPTCLD